jgi:hypothetical protein
VLILILYYRRPGAASRLLFIKVIVNLDSSEPGYLYDYLLRLLLLLLLFLLLFFIEVNRGGVATTSYG